MKTNGQLLDITNAEYQKIPALSFTAMTHFINTPAHLIAYKNEPEKDPTPAQIQGTLSHMAILEPAKFETDVKVVDGHRGAKAVKEEIEFWESQGKMVVKSEQYASAIGSARAVQKHSKIQALMKGGVTEKSIITTCARTGAPIKCRADYIFPEAGIILDFKTFSDLSDRGIDRQISGMKYDLQAIHYLNVGANFLGKDMTLFANVFVETAEPFGVRWCPLPAAAIEKALIKYDYWNQLERYAKCLEKNEWPGYSEDAYEPNLFY